jgi:hypothetical protein
MNAEPKAIALPSLISFLNPLEIIAKATGPVGGIEMINPVNIPAIRLMIIIVWKFISL